MLIFFSIIILSLIFPGIIVRTKSVLSGRKGPSIVQPIYDLIKLFRKGTVYSITTSWIFRFAPVLYFSSAILAALILPIGNKSGIISFEGDFIFFIYLLGLSKFFLIIAALDTGSAFEGMGSSREALYSMLVEPAFFILLASFALLSGNSSFEGLFNTLTFDTSIALFIGILAAYTLFHIALLENSRLPYDDPKTHLELTMIHEVMVLDYSGFDLALIQWTGHIKFVLYSLLVSNFFLKPEMNLGLQFLILFATTVLFAISVGFIESFRARHKLRNNNKAIVILTSIAILVFFGSLLVLKKLF
ncbi:MAG TPA: NADH-quinone oxidoreductase subunit H [Bacteroidales bacterium]|jgi:formate hydrogenlyase subunit 4|nr:NADH-quinone oxidoreductase subunit H [Bacteroidales bacterium]HOL98269.1 NADH-quinone oxidoreductase subunit H [Bacteroidales bacterium]HUM32979.1 NADH-quinone oxidoreductase subunit H [Bacteroidales bacterium]